MAPEIIAILISALSNFLMYSIQLLLYVWDQGKTPISNDTGDVQKNKLLAPHDYLSGKLGDTFGLTAICIGVGHVFFEEPHFLIWMVFCFVFSLAISCGYLNYCRLVDKNDWSFTRGKLTLSGWYHLLYIFFGVSVSSIGIGFIIMGKTDKWILLALAGGIFYLLTVVIDIRAGRHRQKFSE